jgi:hypothetical protein
MKALLLACVVAIVAAPVPSTAAAKTCTLEQGKAAETAVDHLDSWQEVHSAFKQYAQCDDGGVAEGFSDRIVHLLATQWPRLPELAQYTRNDPAFRAFVLKHIDATADDREIRDIASLAESRCPVRLRQLCSALKDAAINPDR